MKARASCACAGIGSGAVVAAGDRGYDVVGEFPDRDAIRIRENHGSFDDVLEFADVARPAVAREPFQRVVRNGPHGLAEERAEVLEEVIAEQRDVVPPLPERRNREVHHVEAVVEVFAEPPVRDVLFEVSRCRGDHANVHLLGLRLPDRAHLLFLQHPQELHLERQGQLSDLVEEEGSVVGLDEEAAPRATGAGERALCVTEEFALEQAVRNCAAVDRNECLCPTWRLGVDGTRQYLFACTALAREKGGGLVGRRSFEHLEQLDHPLRGRDDRAVAEYSLDVALQLLVGLAELLPFVGLLQREQDLVGLEGLREVVVGAPAHGLDGEILGAVGGHQHDRDAGEMPRDLRHQLEAVDPRHAQVAQDHVDGVLFDAGEGGFTAIRCHHRVALSEKDQLEALSQRLVVVDDQDPFGHARSLPTRPVLPGQDAQPFVQEAACAASNGSSAMGCGQLSPNPSRLASREPRGIVRWHTDLELPIREVGFAAQIPPKEEAHVGSSPRNTRPITSEDAH